MPDNVSLPASGAQVATDEIGGVHFQRIKVAWGVDGAAADTSPGNPLPEAPFAVVESGFPVFAPSSLTQLRMTRQGDLKVTSNPDYNELWRAASITGLNPAPVTTATTVTLRAGVAGTIALLDWLTIQNAHASQAVTVLIGINASVRIWHAILPAAMPEPAHYVFPNGLICGVAGGGVTLVTSAAAEVHFMAGGRQQRA